MQVCALAERETRRGFGATRRRSARRITCCWCRRLPWVVRRPCRHTRGVCAEGGTRGPTVSRRDCAADGVFRRRVRVPTQQRSGNDAV